MNALQTTPQESRKSFAEACLEIINLLKKENGDKLYSPNNIAIRTNLNRQTVEKCLQFLQTIQSEFFDTYELDVEDMNNNRKVIGISKRRKFSEYPTEIQIARLKKDFPNMSPEEIEKIFT